MSRTRKQLGALGERIAADYLKHHGYEILETNFRCPGGEIDVVAQHGDCLVFVEVRTRSSRSYGTPEESLTTEKKRRLIELGQAYRQVHENLPSLWRIDVVAVELDSGGKVARIELIENAIS